MFNRAFYSAITAKDGTKCQIIEKPATWGSKYCNIVSTYKRMVIVYYCDVSGRYGVAAVNPDNLSVCTEGSLVLGTVEPIVQPFIGGTPEYEWLKILIDDPSIPPGYLANPTVITSGGAWRM